MPNDAAEKAAGDVSEIRGLRELIDQYQCDLAMAQSLAGIGSWSFDVASGKFSLSDEYYRIAGYEPGAFDPTWENCLACVHPDDRQRVQAEDLVHSARSNPNPMLVRMLCPSGDIRFVQSRVTAITGSNGEPVRICGTIEDVTDRRHSESEIAHVLSNARCLLWQADVVLENGHFGWNTVIRNAAAASQFLPVEIPPGSDYSMGFYLAKLLDDSEGMRQMSEDALLGGQSGYQQEYRLRLADGDVRWIFEDVSIELLATGHWRLVGVCTDVTESKKAREEILQLLESARCLLWQATVVETDGRFEWNLAFRNPEAAQQFLPVVIPEGGTYTQGFFAARLPEYRDEVRLQSRTALRLGHSGYRQEFPVRDATGQLRWLSEDVNIEPLEPGRWRLTGVCTDITDQKESQEETAQILASAHCLLWQAEVTEDEGEMHWNLAFRNPEAAQQFLPVEVPEGGTYTDGFYGARPSEYDDVCNSLSEHALRHGESRYCQEFPVRSAVGDLRWLSEDVHIEPRGSGKWRLTGVCTDITERKLVEDSMLQIQASARCLLWEANVEDSDGHHLWTLEILNPEAAQQLLTLDILPGETYTEAFYSAKMPEDLARLDATGKNALLQGLDSYQQDYPIRVASGEIRWLDESVSIEKEGEGRWRLTGVCVDVTERRLAEEALRRSEAKYQRIVSNVPGVVGQLLQHPDGSLDVTYINAACIEMFGRRPEEYMQDPGLILETIHPDHRQSFIDGIAAAAKTLAPWKWEGKCVLPCGQVNWIETTFLAELQSDLNILWDFLSTDVTPRKEVEDIMRQVQAELQDRVHDRTRDLRHANVALQEEIAERKLAEKELKASETRYRAIVEDQTEMICRFLPDGTLTFVNEAHCRYYGAKAEDLLGRSFIDRLSPEDASRVQAHLASLGPDNPVDSYEMQSRSRDGGVRWQHWTNRYIWDEEGEFLCFQSVGRDITARKQSQEALLLAKEEAERANLAKSEFLSRMSHELRTPLNAILGFGQFLDRDELTALQKESVGHILKGGSHLLGLINEILDLARVEAGRTEVSIEPVSVLEVVQESCDLVRSLGTEKQVVIRFDRDQLEPHYALADLQRLKQVMINLLSNGVKYNRRGGTVEIRCSRQANDLRIEVCDTGIGIAADDLPKLFRPFERLTGSSAVEGTGLGLALSKRLMVLMGGTLEAQSQVEVGTILSIALPVANPPERAPLSHSEEQTAALLPSVNQRKRTVLCIEDNPSNLRLVEVILGSRVGVELLPAIQGSIGLDLARRFKPDLILLDINLPDISGREVLQLLRQEEVTREIPVVVVSADATPLRMERLLSGGADAYLTKPLDATEFLKVVDKFLKLNE